MAAHRRTASAPSSPVAPPAPSPPPPPTTTTAQFRDFVAMEYKHTERAWPVEGRIRVSDLPCKRTNFELFSLVQEEFARFGECVVRINRRVRKMPYALVQFRFAADAFDAASRYIYIDGRLARITSPENEVFARG